MSQLEHLKAHAERLQSRLKAVQTQGVAVAKRGTSAVATVAGGATSGLIEVYLPKIPGTEIETDMALGGAITAIGVFGLLGQMDDVVTDYGSGIMACVTSRGLKKALGKT